MVIMPNEVEMSILSVSTVDRTSAASLFACSGSPTSALTAVTLLPAALILLATSAALLVLESDT